MANPCDVGICDSSRCRDEQCMGILSLTKGLHEPSAGSKCLEDVWNSCPDHGTNEICSCIKLQREREAYIRGANQYAQEKTSKK